MQVDHEAALALMAELYRSLDNAAQHAGQLQVRNEELEAELTARKPDDSAPVSTPDQASVPAGTERVAPTGG